MTLHETASDVSIVIASYNSAEFLPATLESCLAQTMPAREVILVDDGSTDATGEVCARYRDRVRIHRVPNGGVSAARNTGAGMADGDWLLFLDSDDILLPTALASLTGTARRQPCGVAYGMVIQRLAPPKEPRLSGFNYCAGEPPVPARKNFRRSHIITPGSAIVKRSLHERTGGFVPGYEPMEDRDYWTKCGLLAAVAFCDTVVLDKTWRDGSAGTQDAKRIWRGLRAQRALRGWCAGQGLDFSWAGPDADLARFAVMEALHCRTDAILPALLAVSRACGYRGVWYYRALLRLARNAVSGSQPPPPAWLDPAPKN
ncbi:MAG TPA: glycosyltransferase family 2 protein [Terrimicrobiaceae bacterium]|nr:glycosyltransferase family 2 protein [Terrimicrobiaceae bacterium]